LTKEIIFPQEQISSIIPYVHYGGVHVSGKTTGRFGGLNPHFLGLHTMIGYCTNWNGGIQMTINVLYNALVSTINFEKCAANVPRDAILNKS